MALNHFEEFRRANPDLSPKEAAIQWLSLGGKILVETHKNYSVRFMNLDTNAQGRKLDEPLYTYAVSSTSCPLAPRKSETDDFFIIDDEAVDHGSDSLCTRCVNLIKCRLAGGPTVGMGFERRTEDEGSIRDLPSEEP